VVQLENRKSDATLLFETVENASLC